MTDPPRGVPPGPVARSAVLTAVTGALADLDLPAGRPERRLAWEVVGEPGTGKTWTLEHLRIAARDQGRSVLAGRARQSWRDMSYRPLVGALEALCQQQLVSALGRTPAPPTSPETRRLIGELLPRADAPAPGRARDWRALFEELARPCGLVVVLDDMHWADPATVNLVGQLLRRPPAAPVLLALGYRPRQLGARLAGVLAAADRLERVTLAPLPVAEAHALLGPDTDRATALARHAAADGNPRYLAAVADADAWQLTPGIDGMLALTALPSAVQEATDAELAGLSRAAHVVGWAAAVAADTVDPGLLAAVADLDAADVSRGVDELLDHDLIRQCGTSPRYRLRHPVVRFALYGAPDESWRRAAHLRAATALARRGAGPLVLAHHLARSGRGVTPRLAVRLAAAAVPAATGTPTATARVLTEVLRRMPHGGPWTAVRDPLCAQLAHALALAGQLPASRQVARDLLRQPAVHGDARARAMATYALAARLLGDTAAQTEALRRYTETAHAADDTAAALVALEWATTALLAGDGRQAFHAAARVWHAAERRGDRPLEAAARAVGALAAAVNGDVPAANRHRDRAALLVDAFADGELARCLAAAAALGWCEVLLEHHTAAARHLRRALAVAAGSGQRHLAPHLFAGAAVARQLAGDLTDATRAADDALAAADTLGSDDLRAMAFTIRCAIALCGGDRDTAVRAGELAVAAGGARPGRWSPAAGIALAHARLAARPGPAHVATLLRAGGGPGLPGVPPVHRAVCYAALVHAELSRDRQAAAADWLHRLESSARHVPELLRPAGYALLARARLLLATGQPVAAQPLASEAAATFTRAGAALDIARCDLITGLAATRLGRRAQALSDLKRAQVAFADAGAPGLHRAAVRALRRLGHRTGYADAGSPLTDRESEVARLVAAGHTNAQVAARLALSPRTVDAHLRHIFEKLGVANRTALAAAVTRLPPQPTLTLPT